MDVMHVEAITRAEHARREAERKRADGVFASPAIAPDSSIDPSPVQTFAIVLFERIDRPAITARKISLRELVSLLTTFQQLTDKREGRCWSPAQYADGASTRGNAGVAAITALVFDLDRVPPDHDRLKHAYWIGHTTWSHRLESPKWRVIVPLAEPVTAAKWAETWHRARLALCPEADPSCKDPSRAYWLPSHPPRTSVEAIVHEGALLN
ncbi:MAG: hypothetical protein JOZ81_22305, partial [Chloroflexi bacterium]|nr:hypothetical protein [Chloroflexota bacterium]